MRSDGVVSWACLRILPRDYKVMVWTRVYLFAINTEPLFTGYGVAVRTILVENEHNL